MKTKSLKFGWLIFLCIVSGAAFGQTSNFQVTPSDDEYQVTISWTANTENQSGFVIHKEWSSYYEYNTDIIVPPNTTSYVDTAVDPNVTYYYSPGIDNITLTAIVFRQPPPVPQVTLGYGPYSSIKISFIDESDLEVGYEIQHSGNGEEEPPHGDFHFQEFLNSGVMGDTITAYINLGPFYRYSEDHYRDQPVHIRVRSFGVIDGKRVYSDFSPEMVIIAPPAPAKPTNFTATLVGNSFQLNWVDNATSEAAYLLVRATSADWSGDLVELSMNATSYIDNSIAPNVEYFYSLMAIDRYEYTGWPSEYWRDIFSETSRVATVTVMQQKFPEAPYLTAEAVDQNTIDLHIIDSSYVVSWYNVEISNSPEGPFSYQTDMGEKSVEIPDLEPSTTYYFRVQGVLELGRTLYYSPYSNIASVTTLADATSAPEAPVAKLATFVTPTSFTANWKSVASADHYELDVFNIKDSVYLPGFEGKVVYDTSFHITGTRASRRYIYVVRAVNENGESPNSNTILVAPIKGLTLRTVCSNDPSTHRRWKIINNNQVPVEVSWHVNNTPQTGTHLAAIGESYFMTQTVSGLNKTTITWMDDKLVQHASTKSSTWKTCDNDSLARNYVHADEIETEDLPLTMVIYPNSVTDKFQLMISSASNKVVQVEVINLQGISMVTKNVTPNTNVEFDASAYASGIYLVRARQATKHKTLKLFKQ